MANQVQSGTMLIQQLAILGLYGTEGELYCENWRSLGAHESSSFEHAVRAAGWGSILEVVAKCTCAEAMKSLHATSDGPMRMSELRL
jgi:hypothetical protein